MLQEGSCNRPSTAFDVARQGEENSAMFRQKGRNPERFWYRTIALLEDCCQMGLFFGCTLVAVLSLALTDSLFVRGDTGQVGR